MLGEAIEVPLNVLYLFPGIAERILPPWAVISGFNFKSGVGPQLEKFDMNGPACCSRLNVKEPLDFLAKTSPSSWLIEQKGIAKLLPADIEISPETLLYKIAPIAPCSAAIRALSSNELVPRRTRAIFPLTSIVE